LEARWSYEKKTERMNRLSNNIEENVQLAREEEKFYIEETCNSGTNVINQNTSLSGISLSSTKIELNSQHSSLSYGQACTPPRENKSAVVELLRSQALEKLKQPNPNPNPNPNCGLRPLRNSNSKRTPWPNIVRM